MEILTTANAWQRRARISDAEGRVTAWTRKYEADFPTVLDVYYSAWGDRGRRRDAALRAPELTQRIRAAESRAVGYAAFGTNFPRIKDRNVSRSVAGHSAYFTAVTLEA